MTFDVTQYYSKSSEDDRLRRSPHGRLEFLRTQELVRRVLTRPATVLDVGGGTGVHAEWLAADGHTVRLIDPVREHIAMAATLSGVTAEVGDARRLPVADGGVDAVPMPGPLYHLVESADRATALAEAVRVLRPGGSLIAAGISRYLPAWPVLDHAGPDGLGTLLAAALECARLVEEDPRMIGASAHLLAIGRR